MWGVGGDLEEQSAFSTQQPETEQKIAEIAVIARDRRNREPTPRRRSTRIAADQRKFPTTAMSAILRFSDHPINRITRSPDFLPPGQPT